MNCLNGITVGVPVSSTINCGFKPYSGQGQNKDYNIGIYYFCAKHTTIRSKNKAHNNKE